MRKTHIFLIGLAIIVIGLLVYTSVVKPALDNRTVSTIVTETIDRPDLSFSFAYPSGDEGYSLMEQPGETVSSTGPLLVPEAGTSTPPASVLRHMFLLMNTRNYTDYQAGGLSGDVPPAISVIVYDNSKDQTEGDRLTRLKNWALRNNDLTVYSQVTGEPALVELDGVNAIQYQITGDTSTTFTIASYRGNIYVFAVQHDADTGSLRDTYDRLLDSVTFY